MSDRVPVIEMRDVTKIFPGVIANDHINLAAYEGEVLGLLGENGAGKSVLMSILYGLYQPTEGQIFVRGEEVAITEPMVAIEQGIGMVHQHFMLVPVFTVAENIVLGSEPRTSRGTLDMDKAIQEITELSEKYGLEVDPNAKIEDISVGMAQRVEILKTMYRVSRHFHFSQAQRAHGDLRSGDSYPSGQDDRDHQYRRRFAADPGQHDGRP